MSQGEFNDKRRARQLVSFSGFSYGKITPTDMDGLIEYHNACYVLMEFKHGDKEMDYGQYLAFKRLTDDLEAAHKPTVLLVCSHNIDNPDMDIIAKDACVRKFYYRGRWYGGWNRTVKEVTDRFLSHVNAMKGGGSYG